jgi:hypothetical protein
MSEKKIEFEEITVKVPKEVLRFIKAFHGDLVEWLEYHIVDLVNAQIDGMNKEQIIESFNLEEVFKTILEE